MAGSEEVPRCSSCKTRVDTGTVVEIVVRKPDERNEAVLCEECAVVSCTNCGSDVAIAGAGGGPRNIWERHELHECGRCGESVPAREIAELRHENNPGYRKQVCDACLEEIPIPSNIRVIRDVS